MKYKGTIIGEASGSVASLTFSHNRGGQYIRQRSVPVNPNTVFQQLIRGYFAQLASRWVDSLTAPQRDSWETYAQAVPLPDSLGEPRVLNGMSMYQRCNTPRLQVGLARSDDAPTIYNLGTFTGLDTDTVSAAADTVDTTFDTGDAWVDLDGAGMLVYCSRPQNQTINYFKGPYRLAGVVLGNSTIPPTSPDTLSLPFVVAADHKVFVKKTVSHADGRYTAPFRFSVIAA